MHPPLVVPETTPATDVLVRLRQAGAQLALIVDEYGGTAGMVSLEDLVGAIIGKTDENGLSMFSLTDELDGSRLLDGLMSLVELDDRHGVDLASDGVDVESLGGYVFARLGRVAVVGDEVISAKGHVLRVEQMDDLRIAQVRIRPADSTSLDAYS
jgi:CBS domain containing-hemolysin-like protein